MANFDLVNVSENSPLVKQFIERISKSTGQIVTAFIAQKMKKVASEATKDLDFVLENGQTITLVVRTDGDVVRVKLNGKDLPLKSELFHFSADSFELVKAPQNGRYSLAANESDRNSPASVFAKAVEEIATRVRQNQAAFDKRQSQEKVVIPKKSGGSNASSTSVSVRTKEVRSNLDNLDKEIIEKTALRDDLKSKLEARKQQILQVNQVSNEVQ
jgi:hypothetical protein